MSDIQGEGWGSGHDWEKVFTSTVHDDNRWGNASLYVCKVCKARFCHLYAVRPDIFDAMEENEIPEECNKGENQGESHEG